MAISPSAAGVPPRRTPGYVVYSALAVPILIIGQFALLAILPIALLMFGTWRDLRGRALRWWAGLTALLYAAALTIWQLNPNGAESLSKDIHPLLAGLIVAAAIILLAKIYRRRTS